MAQGCWSPSLRLRHLARGGGKVTVTCPGSAAGTSCSAAVVAESRRWLEKQTQDGVCLRGGEGTEGEDGQRAGACRGKAYFWHRWFDFLAGVMRGWDEWEVMCLRQGTAGPPGQPWG